MTEPLALDYRTPRPTGPPLLLRGIILMALVALAIVALYVLFKTPIGAKLRDRSFVLGWVGDHRFTAPLVLVGVYILFAVLMLPVWQIQLAAGYCFGLVMGIFWCEIGAVIGGVIALLLSRWLMGQWFRARYESRIARLHAINDKLGDNGLLVVMGIRLCHLLPFGLSNYLFGLTRITAMDVALGTLGGGMPAIGAYVIFGAGRAREFKPWAVLTAINIVMLIPLAIKYWKPRWTRKPDAS
jgi:uncharacterized membrane protein YdjX (TVP38/TMEM64 family)